MNVDRKQNPGSLINTGKIDHVNQTSLSELPEELRQYIFSFLGARQLGLLNLASKAIQRSANNHTLWQRLCNLEGFFPCDQLEQGKKNNEKSFRNENSQPIQPQGDGIPAGIAEKDINWKELYQQKEKFFFSHGEVANFRGEYLISFEQCDARKKIDLSRKLKKRTRPIDLSYKITGLEFKKLICHHLHLPKNQVAHMELRATADIADQDSVYELMDGSQLRVIIKD